MAWFDSIILLFLFLLFSLFLHALLWFVHSQFVQFLILCLLHLLLERCRLSRVALPTGGKQAFVFDIQRQITCIKKYEIKKNELGARVVVF